jgi:hypothetical protein
LPSIIAFIWILHGYKISRCCALSFSREGV